MGGVARFRGLTPVGQIETRPIRYLLCLGTALGNRVFGVAQISSISTDAPAFVRSARRGSAVAKLIPSASVQGIAPSRSAGKSSRCDRMIFVTRAESARGVALGVGVDGVDGPDGGFGIAPSCGGGPPPVGAR